jgi:hypothetical protein
MPALLEITSQDVETLRFVAARYCWSENLLGLTGWEVPAETLSLRITARDLRSLRAAIRRDARGGHSPYPLLDPSCDLRRKLRTLTGI